MAFVEKDSLFSLKGFGGVYEIVVSDGICIGTEIACLLDLDLLFIYHFS